MKCPYCGSRHAKVDCKSLKALKGAAPIHSAIDCINPTCIAYSPILYGDHPDMLPEQRRVYEKYKTVLEKESDLGSPSAALPHTRM